MRTEKHALNCECGTKVEVRLRRFLDVGAEPGLEWELVRGELNAAKCGNCGKFEYVDEPFTYFDEKRGEVIKVLPASMREEPEAAERCSGYKLRTRTLYGLGALVNFVAAERGVPERYRDSVAEQAQIAADEHRLVSESRCRCGSTFKVERSVIRNFQNVPVEIVKARCKGCGGAKSFFIQVQPLTAQRGKRLEAPVTVR
ncbi:MAG: hypothetical protein JTT11_02680 [Candidatus Brockarchaeota archaeon]|nr:hypothetical protein [Candidatus Brockarchaeota archaeon]